jgi:4-hydroxy-tetrahydrodipicolinate reductase
MNIILLGYGKMGKAIERIALERGHTIAARIDADNQQDLDTATGDVVIEFSHPDAAFENIKKCLQRGLPIISGTTGWLNRKGEIEALCAERQGTFFYASNYSLGVNIFFKVNEFLSRIMNGFDGYEPELAEIHHTEKKDAPSGTAITLAEGVLKHVSRKKSWAHDQAAYAPAELAISSARIGLVPGTHSVKYVSAVDDLEIKHTAHTRDGFALGAVLVAEWIKGRKGLLNMDDFLKF